MAVQTNSPSRMSRLGIFTSRAGPSRPGPSSPLSRDEEVPDDEWYIPYNGPYEPPPKRFEPESRDSWGELLSELLSEEEDGGGKGGASARDARASKAASAPEEDRTRSRAVSNASRQTKSTGQADASRRNTNARASHLRSNPLPRAPTMSYVNLDQLGGVGEAPTPVERTAPQSFPSTPQRESTTPSSNRASLASIFTFGRRKSLRMSTSMDNLGRDRTQSNAEPPLPTTSLRSTPGRARSNTSAVDTPNGRMSHEDEYYHSYYSTLLATPGKGLSASPEEEPSSLRSHPYAYPYVEPAQPQSAPPALDRGKGRLVVPRITLLDPRGPKIPAYLKPSPRNSLLKASISTPNLKGKQRWLAAETWCDALILPRPRFAMKLVDGAEGGSGRLVSPPPSPIRADAPPDPAASIQPRPGPAAQQAALSKARSTGQFESPRPAPAPPSPPPTQPVASTSTALRPPRPKSWAWDDLALPSPVPSLAKVLADGKQLEEERKAWQAQAGKSFLDKRANTISRARSKSIGATRKPHARSKSGERRAFEALAERTLVGAQTRPPTIHVRTPSLSRTSHAHSQSQSQSATAHGTFSSYRPFSRSGTGSRTRSHAHSNSLGNNTVSYRSTSDDTPPGPNGNSPYGHARSQSFGKSAFKLVVTTASNAAAFCGLAGDRTTPTPASEKADAMETAIHTPGTKVIHLQDQMSAEQNRPEADHLVVISSTSPTAALAMVNRNGVSPTPSALSGSAEGVGVAISGSDDHSRQPAGREPIRMPSHPYAQNAGYRPVLPQSPESYDRLAAIAMATTRPDRAEDDDAANRHRQPVQVHPYAQVGHPYAAPQSRPQYIEVPPQVSMFAELTPGHVREIAPEDIRRYSPEVPTPTVILDQSPKGKAPQMLASTSAPSHPYATASNRMSELVFGEALMHTMRRQGSVDSGLGTSDYGGDSPSEVDWRAPTADLSPDAVDDIVRMHNAPGSQTDISFRAGRPLPRHEHSQGMASNHTVASSPMENILPPAFRRMQSEASGNSLSTKLGTSSGSSPGMVSHDSSPPLSPRPIDTTEDLEKYRDLFYRPSHNNSAESVPRTTGGTSRSGSQGPAGSIPFDVSSRSSRGGLSTLVRQFSEEMHASHEDIGDEHRMWGRRHGGLRGPRPDDLHDAEPPNVVLARFTSPTSNSSPRSGYDTPLRLPIDTSFVSPTANIPEDVESSRASSILEFSPLNETSTTAETFRVGSIEAVSTPPIINTPHRFSTELSLIGHTAADFGVTIDDRRDSDYLEPRVVSERSTLLTPISPNARSSYMTSNTDTSRMSGLSDFPAPPSLLPPSANISASNLHAEPPRLVREPSHGTFGRQDSASEYGVIGEAL